MYRGRLVKMVLTGQGWYSLGKAGTHWVRLVLSGKAGTHWGRPVLTGEGWYYLGEGGTHWRSLVLTGEDGVGVDLELGEDLPHDGRAVEGGVVDAPQDGVCVLLQQRGSAALIYTVMCNIPGWTGYRR